MQMSLKSPQTIRLTILFIGTALLAVASGNSAENPRHPLEVLSAFNIARRAIIATEHSWQVREHYNYIKRDEDRRLDGQGQIKSTNIDVFKMTVVHGERFEQAVEHNGRPPSAAEIKKLNEDFEKLKRESSDGRTSRLRKDQENKALLEEVLQAFDFQLVGEDTLSDRAAYVVAITPHPGYHPRGRYARMLSKLEGKLWVDKQDFGWIKFDGQVTDSFAVGLFIARVQRGAHLLVEQTPLGDAVWLPKRIELQAGAKVFFMKNFAVDRIFTYSDYRPADGLYSVSR